MSVSLSKKRITLVISLLSGGGAERVTCNLANYLNRKGYLVDIVTLSETKNPYRIDPSIKEVCLLKDSERRNLIYNNLIRRNRLKKYIKENEEVFCYVTMLSMPSFLLTSLKKYIKGKIIVSERNNPATTPFLDRMMMKYSVKRSDGLVVQTKKISEYYEKTRKKIVISNAINEDVKLSERRCVEKKIVAVGRLEKQKNYPMMIKAFAIFSKKHPEYKLEIYGQGRQEKKIKRMVDKYGLTGKVVFMGYVKNVSERIANATCFVMTSNYEGISNALIEAMCIGLPCVVTDSDGGGAKELIEDGKNGVLIMKGDLDGLVCDLSKVVDDVQYSKRLSENAIKLREKLNSQNIYASWNTFINKIANEEYERK